MSPLVLCKYGKKSDTWVLLKMNLSWTRKCTASDGSKKLIHTKVCFLLSRGFDF